MTTHQPIHLGDTTEREYFELDFDEAGIRFILLAGMTESGKSIFHSHLYRELMRAYSPNELGFVFLDMTRVDFADWDVRYLARPIVHNVDDALRVLGEIAESDDDRKLVIHIEECDMVYRDRARMEASFDRLRLKKNTLVVYSTSRIDPAYLTDWMEKYVDMKVVFRVANADDSQLLLGNDAAVSFTLPGERILAYQDKQVRCMPIEVRDL